ncbi:hypothetical protein DWG18_07650 [Lysobacter sp. TY2-98]|uniref:hypothetical protein n=1 Tax=Lysobacter sp. TY2-98 TaxID=2290922 RepID=UPI000E201C69|nr:hypothetical protein [Lysobacter sp. TY2-98]AXK72170.1 hypothetical protein DWG18_07650 [Lysobacter sp. TY2-98]
MTDPSDHDARRSDLIARRDALYAEQKARDEARERAGTVAEFLRWHAADLANVSHALHWPWEPDGVRFPAYPWAFSGIDWARVPGANTRYGGTEEVLAELFTDALDALGIPADRRLRLQWGVAHLPDVTLARADAERLAERLMRWSSDLWIHDPTDVWAIEIYHEGTLSYARRPPDDGGSG